MSGALLGPGHLAVYIKCEDPGCPDRREGTEHAHLDRVDQATDAVDQDPS